MMGWAEMKESPFNLFHGDCLTVLQDIPSGSIDSVVTDPPYGLSDHKPPDVVECLTAWLSGEEYRPNKKGFMGRAWDSWVPGPEVWREVFRVLKPGGHVVAFAGSRTHDLMSMALRLAGFECRDTVMWIYGSGFPKSMDVSKQIDKSERGVMVREKLIHFAEARGIDGKWLEAHGVASASSFNDWTVGGHVPSDKNWSLVKVALGVTSEEEAAFERRVIGRSENGISGGSGKHAGETGAYGFAGEFNITAPATDAARQWSGWGTALKPAFEPALLFRKPLAGTVAENVLAHGTGALNIDGCRVPHADQGDEAGYREKCASVVGLGSNRNGSAYGEWTGERQDSASALGRFPANLIHDGSPEVLAHFPDSNGAGPSLPRVKVTGYGGGIGSGESAYTGGERIPFSAGSGSAARFFYCAKASKRDRNEGCEHIAAKQYSHDGRETPIDNAYQRNSSNSSNSHPTVKPTDLMRYLCRLVTPAGGVVLDPFMGSGSTGKAAILEGFGFVGIEREINYVEIAQSRIARCLGEKQEKELRPVVQDLFAEVD